MIILLQSFFIWRLKMVCEWFCLPISHPPNGLVLVFFMSFKIMSFKIIHQKFWVLFRIDKG